MSQKRKPYRAKIPPSGGTLGHVMGLKPPAPPDPAENRPYTPYRSRGGWGDLLLGGVDAFMGGIGLPVTDSTTSQFGELIAAALPVFGSLKAVRAVKSAKAPIKAYHGSPHDFDQFSMDKIGTGEGAQAYGHGLYFADSEKVAKSYRDNLSDGLKAYDGQPITKNGMPWSDGADPLETAKFTLAHFKGDKVKAKASLLARASDYDGGVNQRHADWYKQSASAIDGLDPSKVGESAGKMYEVNIHADPDDFLDWDAPLSQQQAQKASKALGDVRPVKLPNGYFGVTRIGPDGSGKIIQGINESSPDAALSRWNTTFDGMSGANANTVLSGIAGDRAAVTEGLKAQGIPGIKYFDGGSRGAKQGTRNYVVFDDKLISIVKKYGIAGALAAGLINESQARQMQAQGIQ